MFRLFKTEGGKFVPADVIGPDTWVRLTQPTPDEISLVSSTLSIDVTEISASLDRDEGSRWEVDGDITTILIDIPYRKTAEDSSPYDTMPLAIIRSHNTIVTVCQIESTVINKFADGSMKCVDLDNKMNFVLRLLYGISLEYQVYLREINARRKEIEKSLYSSTTNADLMELHRLESSLVYFATSLTACNVVLDKIRRSIPETDKRTLDLVHDVLIENEQAVEMATTYRKIIDSTRDLFVAVMNNKLNYAIRWLAALTIILSIPMIVSGIYGMNVRLPLGEIPYAFTAVMGIMIMLCAGAALYLKRLNMF